MGWVFVSPAAIALISMNIRKGSAIIMHLVTPSNFYYRFIQDEDPSFPAKEGLHWSHECLLATLPQYTILYSDEKINSHSGKLQRHKQEGQPPIVATTSRAILVLVHRHLSPPNF